jgi:AraC-like DNA-binding protein
MSVTRHHPPRLARHHLERHGRIDRHDHDRHQLLCPTSGVISVTTDTGTWVIPPLRAIWLPAYCPHAHAAHGKAELCSILLPAEASPLDPGRPTLLAVSPLLREVLLALTAATPLRDDERARLEAIVFDQIRPAPASASYLLPEPGDDRLQAIARILRADPGDSRTLTEFAQAVGSSERTLSRLFRSDTGMSFPQWRSQLRLQAALIDLAAGTPVGTVAHRCGYSTPSAFIATFHQAFGITPGTYRQRRT